jgi:hypothetical protein
MGEASPTCLASILLVGVASAGRENRQLAIGYSQFSLVSQLLISLELSQY